MSKTIHQKHHIIYPDGKNPEVIANVRKGVHHILGLIKRYSYLEHEEIWAIIVETLLKRRSNAK